MPVLCLYQGKFAEMWIYGEISVCQIAIVRGK